MKTDNRRMRHRRPRAQLTAVLLAITSPAWAGSTTQLGEDTTLDYSGVVNYGLAARAEKASPALTTGGTSAFGLPEQANSDDGDRNFKRGSLVNNRLSLLLEGDLKHRNLGFFLRGSAFYDDVYNRRNDNDSPATVNKTGPNNEFTDEARHIDGRRARFLDAYAYGNFQLGSTELNLRAGDQVVAWGESLYFPGIAGAQGPADATKANVPGVEVKDIFLPVGQVAGQWALNDQLTLLGYYRYKWKPTELDPVGSYLSYTDVVGPGAQMLLLAPGFSIPRGPDINPRDTGQWGLGTRFSPVAGTTFGFYHLRYHDTNPNVVVNIGAGGMPTDYQIKYFDDIKLTGASFSTKAGAVSLAGEVSMRDGVPVLVNTLGGGVSATRAKDWQAQVSGIYMIGPSSFASSQTLVGEIGYNRVQKLDAVNLFGMSFDELTNTRNAAAYQVSWTPLFNNVFNGWDLQVPVVFAHQFKGKSAVAGAFGSLVGEGDKRLSVGTTFTYLNNLQIGLTYNAYLGKADPVTRPLADRDYVALNAKYSF